LEETGGLGMQTPLYKLRASRDEFTERLVHLQEQYAKDRADMLEELARLTDLIDAYKKQPPTSTYSSMHTSLKGIDHEST
jgi:hypothetical protein